MSGVKKKFLVCNIHGLTLFRCRRKCWQRGGKDNKWASQYKEQCFKCISEGRYKIVEIREKKKQHFKVYGTAV